MNFNCIILIALFPFLACSSGHRGSVDGHAEEDKMSGAEAIGEIVSEITSNPMCVFQDSRNNYWFGGAEEGVYKFDNQNLILYTKDDGLCSHTVLGIQEDKIGNLYFDTTEGVSKFDGLKFITLEPVKTSDTYGQWKLQADDLWFRVGWNHPGAFRYDGESLYELEFPTNGLGDAFNRKYPSVSFSPYGVYSIYKDSKGSVWFGTSSLGACRYDGEKISWVNEHHLVETEGGGSPGIRSILEDKNGDYWFSNTRYRYEVMSETTTLNGTIHADFNKADGLEINEGNGKIEFPYFMSIAEDQHGSIWIATYSDGIWKSDGDKLIQIPIHCDVKEPTLFSVYIDNLGSTWLTSHNAGVLKLNNDAFEKFKIQ